MSIKTRTLGAAGLVAAGVLSLASAGYAADEQEGKKAHLKATPAIRTVGAPAISKAATKDSTADRVRGRLEGKLDALGRSPETLQELERLKAMREGRLRASEQAFGDGDCGPGVRAPAGVAGNASNCDREDDRPRGRRRGSRADEGTGLGWGPPGMRGSRRQGPDPRSFIGDGSSREKPNAYIDGRSRSAKGRSGLKDFGSGRAQQGGSSSGRIDKYGTLTRTRREDTDGDGVADTLTVEREYQDGSRLSYKQTSEGEHSWQVDNSAHDCDADMCFSQADRDADRLGDSLTGSGDDEETGGEAGQPDPTDTGGGTGNRPWACDQPGATEASCRQAAEARKSEYQKALEAAREDGDHHTMTPQEIFERVGQPVPTPGRGGGGVWIEDRRGIAGFTPPCAADPGGCGGNPGDASAAAPAGVDRGGIAGFTPTCGGPANPCGGSALKESYR